MRINEYISRNPWLPLLIPTLILFLFLYIIPFLWLIRVSFYRNIPGGYMEEAFNLDNYIKFLGDSWNIKNVIFFSFKYAIISGIIAIMISYPIALEIARGSEMKKRFLLTVTLSPLLVSMVCLGLGMLILLRNAGIVNLLLSSIGLIEKPIKLIYNYTGVLIGLIYVAIPYIVLSLIDCLSKIDISLEEAAINMGATRLQIFTNIIFPLSIPGLFAGSIVVFSLNFCAFAIPVLMGPTGIPMIGVLARDRAIYDDNIPYAAVIAITALCLNFLFLYIYSKVINKIFYKKIGIRI